MSVAVILLHFSLTAVLTVSAGQHGNWPKLKAFERGTPLVFMPAIELSLMSALSMIPYLLVSRESITKAVLVSNLFTRTVNLILNLWFKRFDFGLECVSEVGSLKMKDLIK